MVFTFRGGIHPDYHKYETMELPVEVMNPLGTMVYPLSQHIGAPAEPVVKVGDHVKMGQMIAKAPTFVSCPVHASVSGKVIAIAPCPHPSGAKVMSIIVENDYNDEVSEEVAPCTTPIDQLTAEDVMGILSKAGICGMGGAGFPAHVKLQSAIGKVDTLIINGAECEPYLTADHRLMLENPDEILGGVQILMQALGLRSAVIAIEDNKKDAIRVMKRQANRFPGILVATVATKYPQGGEKQLIKAVTNREVPIGKFPADVKCAVFNVETCASLYIAYTTGMPVWRRIVTVSGSGIEEPKNVLARIGTRVEDVIEFCGGLIEEPLKVIIGGPMMGAAQNSLAVPVIKTTSGILIFTEEEGIEPDHPTCIRCGRCNKACPMFLTPHYLVQCAHAEELDECEKLGIMSCIECGSCSYVCPGRMFLVQEFRVAKLKIQERARKKKAEEAARAEQQAAAQAKEA